MKQLDDITLFNRYRVFYRQPSNLDSAREFIRERWQRQDAVILLATEGDRPIGYTQLFSSWRWSLSNVLHKITVRSSPHRGSDKL